MDIETIAILAVIATGGKVNTLFMTSHESGDENNILIDENLFQKRKLIFFGRYLYEGQNIGINFSSISDTQNSITIF